MRHRQIWVAVLCVTLLSGASAQFARRRTISKGPRALGLIEIDSRGRAHLVPVTIMIDGKFYDASVYKADPVPMALDAGTVYEGLKSGVSQGLFTVNNPIPHNGWLGLGIWKSNEQIEAEKEKAKARAAKLAEKPAVDFKAGGPLRLSRTPEGAHPKPAAAAPSKKDNEDADRPVLKKTEPDAEAAPSLTAVESERPVLRRQEPGETEEQIKIEPDDKPLQGALTVIPAISDADGPQPRPYTYETKPEEDRDFMQKMSAMAAKEVEHRVEMLSGADAKAKAGRKAAPEFQDAKLKVVDISETNEAWSRGRIFTATSTRLLRIRQTTTISTFSRGMSSLMSWMRTATGAANCCSSRSGIPGRDMRYTA
jgi:hypothetical protein